MESLAEPGGVCVSGNVHDFVEGKVDLSFKDIGEQEVKNMVEVPAAAMTLDHFGRAEFFSIGSNDLAQYLMAAARDNGAVADLADPSHPALLRLIDQVVEFSRVMDRDLSICGDMASDPNHLRKLVRHGLRTLSVAPAALGEVKAVIRSIRLGDNGG